MKRILLTIAILALSAGFMSAQDLEKITETYNSAAAALGNKDYATALTGFQQALKDAEALGESGAEIVTNCKDIIPDLVLSLANNAIREKDYPKALEGLAEAVKIATEYKNDDVVSKAQNLIPQIKMQQGNALLTAKNYAGAAEIYKALLADDPTNGTAAVRLGQALNAAGDVEGAIEAFTTAAANGQEATANKQLSTIVLKQASNFLKEKKFDEAITAALKSAEYSPSANAYKIAGTAANSLQKKEQAVEYLSKYLELAPTAADAAQIKAAIEALKK
ncbi:MAG: tetratricopeptide repeat protein [Bacteroidales bacterium]|nr:tetratricopeptide repeat protein [Bacteroidales bacterium]